MLSYQSQERLALTAQIKPVLQNILCKDVCMLILDFTMLHDVNTLYNASLAQNTNEYIQLSLAMHSRSNTHCNDAHITNESVINTFQEDLFFVGSVDLFFVGSVERVRIKLPFSHVITKLMFCIVRKTSNTLLSNVIQLDTIRLSFLDQVFVTNAEIHNDGMYSLTFAENNSSTTDIANQTVNWSRFLQINLEFKVTKQLPQDAQVFVLASTLNIGRGMFLIKYTP